VPVLSARDTGALLGIPVPAPFSLRALNLFPAEALASREVFDAQYIRAFQMRKFRKLQELHRSQIELLAGRVSAPNEGIYRTNPHALMLRAGIAYSGRDGLLLGISQAALGGDAEIDHGGGLTVFSTAAVAGDVANRAPARGALRDAAGSGRWSTLWLGWATSRECLALEWFALPMGRAYLSTV